MPPVVALAAKAAAATWAVLLVVAMVWARLLLLMGVAPPGAVCRQLVQWRRHQMGLLIQYGL